MSARWLPKRMKQIHSKAARLLVAGMRVGDVAVAVGVYPTTISHWRRAPGFIALVDRYQREAFQKVCEAFIRRLVNGEGGGGRAKREVSARSLANLRRGRAAPAVSPLAPSRALPPIGKLEPPEPAVQIWPRETIEVLQLLNAANSDAALSL